MTKKNDNILIEQIKVDAKFHISWVGGIVDKDVGAKEVEVDSEEVEENKVRKNRKL